MKYRYRLWCQTDSDYKYVVSETDPTECPDSSEHTIDADSVTKIEPVPYDMTNADDVVFKTIADRRIFAEDMMERLKKLNYDNGINLSQAMWVHHRLRALSCTITSDHATALPPLSDLVGQTVTIDLMNLIISGDLETAFAALLTCTPDDMSEPYHCLSATLVGWIMNELATYLGWS